MNNKELASSLVAQINDLIYTIGDDYPMESKVTNFKKTLVYYREVVKNLEEKGSYDGIDDVLKKVRSEIRQFNLWVDLQTISRALEKNKKKKG